MMILFILVSLIQAASEYNLTEGFGCRKGYYNPAYVSGKSINSCSKCSKAVGTDLCFVLFCYANLQSVFCQNIVEEVDDYLQDSFGFGVKASYGLVSFVAKGQFNCQYKSGCTALSCPTFAKDMDEFYALFNLTENVYRETFIENFVSGGMEEFKRICHYRGCLLAKSKGRCSVWAQWAFVVFLVIMIILIVAIFVAVLVCLRMTNTPNGNGSSPYPITHTSMASTSVYAPPQQPGAATYPPQEVPYYYPLEEAQYNMPQQAYPQQAYPQQGYPPMTLE